MDFNKEPAKKIRHGRLTAFLRRDLFTVQFENGVKITAVMPEEFFPIYNPKIPLTGGALWVSVEVEMREPPAMPKIVAVRRTALLGADYGWSGSPASL